MKTRVDELMHISCPSYPRSYYKVITVFTVLAMITGKTAMHKFMRSNFPAFMRNALTEVYRWAHSQIKQPWFDGYKWTAVRPICKR